MFYKFKYKGKGFNQSTRVLLDPTKLEISFHGAKRGSGGGIQVFRSHNYTILLRKSRKTNSTIYIENLYNEKYIKQSPKSFQVKIGLKVNFVTRLTYNLLAIPKTKK